MLIRKTTINDLPSALQIYTRARRFMVETGNSGQWAEGHPSEVMIREDIAAGKSYVCTTNEGELLGVFYFSIEEDPTYARIDDGAWLNDLPYGVVHRIASGGKLKGIGNFCLQWCFDQCHNLRIDTHRDNRVMQNLLIKNGYQRCGIIYLTNEAERIAYQKTKNTNEQ